MNCAILANFAQAQSCFYHTLVVKPLSSIVLELIFSFWTSLINIVELIHSWPTVCAKLWREHLVEPFLSKKLCNYLPKASMTEEKVHNDSE